MQIAMETVKDYTMCITENENRNQIELTYGSQSRKKKSLPPPWQNGSPTCVCLCTDVFLSPATLPSLFISVG